MEGNDELQKKARAGEIAIKGTKTPDVIGEPVRPVLPGPREVYEDRIREGLKGITQHRDPGDETDAD